MARGWESKGVAEQQPGEFGRPDPEAAREPAHVARQRRRLELSRADVAARLAAAEGDARLEHWRAALAALDEQLRALRD